MQNDHPPSIQFSGVSGRLRSWEGRDHPVLDIREPLSGQTEWLEAG